MKTSVALRFAPALVAVISSTPQVSLGQNPRLTMSDLVGCYALFTGASPLIPRTTTRHPESDWIPQN